MVILITVYKIAESERRNAMLLIRITGAQLRAGRALAGLTIEDLAARADRHTVTKWEGSSNAVPFANVSHLSRALDVLGGEGVRFTEDGGVSPMRTTPAPVAATGTVIRSEVASP
jgi:hypothetical protein